MDIASRERESKSKEFKVKGSQSKKANATKSWQKDMRSTFMKDH